mmetsp:Transcript_26660/g.63182  ORF Transcript_26660/g.63182 Transcript_26660/m.63182 type:complete len:246 (+) Transcript_26660:912-1649(+)
MLLLSAPSALARSKDPGRQRPSVMLPRPPGPSAAAVRPSRRRRRSASKMTRLSRRRASKSALPSPSSAAVGPSCASDSVHADPSFAPLACRSVPSKSCDSRRVLSFMRPAPSSPGGRAMWAKRPPSAAPSQAETSSWVQAWIGLEPMAPESLRGSSTVTWQDSAASDGAMYDTCLSELTEWIRSVGAGETVATMRVWWSASVKHLRRTCVSLLARKGGRVRAPWARKQSFRAIRALLISAESLCI